MVMANPYNKYQESKVFNASPEELTLMLFDGALKFCNQGIVAIERGEVSKAHQLILKVQDIIQEFQITLDRKYPVAQDFDVIFDYIQRRLIEANATKDQATLEDAGNYLREMRDTWKQAMLIAKRSQ